MTRFFQNVAALLAEVDAEDLRLEAEGALIGVMIALGAAQAAIWLLS